MGRLAVLLSALLLSGSAVAAPAMMQAVRLRPMTVVVLPDRATALFNRQSARLTPMGRAWVTAESERLLDGSRDVAFIENDAAAACLSAFGRCGGGDIDALVMIVMMERSSDAQQDLKQIMAEIKANTTAKSQMRAHLQAVHALSAQQLNAEAQALKSQYDSMSDLSEMQSMRLQMAMDRYSKVMETRSNILKKIDQTDDSITKNLK